MIEWSSECKFSVLDISYGISSHKKWTAQRPVFFFWHHVSPISFISKRSPWTNRSAAELLIWALSFRSAPLTESYVTHIQSSLTNESAVACIVGFFCVDKNWPAQKTPGTRLLKITTRTSASWCSPDTNSRICREEGEATGGRNIDKSEKWSQEKGISTEQSNTVNLAYACHFKKKIPQIWIYSCQGMNYSFL